MTIRFTFEEQEYEAPDSFYGSTFTLPDGRIVAAKSWTETMPPKPHGLHVVCAPSGAAQRSASSIITAESLWSAHRAALGGRSAITGAELPLTLAECPPTVQASHWGMALYIARVLDWPEPAAPAAVSHEEQERVRKAIEAQRDPDLALGAALAAITRVMRSGEDPRLTAQSLREQIDEELDRE